MYEKVAAEAKSRMEKTIEDLQRELASVRTGRASVHLLDQVKVDYYGTPTPLNQMATLHAPEAQLLTVQPWDASQIDNIEKAILTADLGLNPSNDGKIIRIPIPALNQERRQQLARQIGKVAEEHRTAIRNIRRDANDKLKKALREKEISEDEEHLGFQKVQEVTDEYVKKINELASAKEEEVLQV